MSHLPPPLPPASGQDGSLALRKVSRTAAEEGIRRYEGIANLYLASGGSAVVAGSARKGIEALEKAAELGSVPAALRLGRLLCDKASPEYDLVRGYRHYLSAANAGDAGAQTRVGIMLRQGQGVAADLFAATHWLTEPARKGDVEAQCQLAQIYSGQDGELTDLQQAVHWAREAAKNGDGWAESALVAIEGMLGGDE